MTSLLSENGPSVTVILPLASRTRTPSLLGNRPPVSTRVPFFTDFSTNLPIASIKAAGGGDSRYDSEWRMKVRYFMAPPQGSDHATNEPGLDRHARSFFWRLAALAGGSHGNRIPAEVPPEERPWHVRTQIRRSIVASFSPGSRQALRARWHPPRRAPPRHRRRPRRARRQRCHRRRRRSRPKRRRHASSRAFRGLPVRISWSTSSRRSTSSTCRRIALRAIVPCTNR